MASRKQTDRKYVNNPNLYVIDLLFFVVSDQLARQPIPQSKAELIGHPLYVLKSKLLKFEGIYPNETPPIGWLKVRYENGMDLLRQMYLQDEPIYSRDNIHVLRSKQTWLKEARQVNLGEEPYKIVDGRIKNVTLFLIKDRIPLIVVDGS